MRHLFLALIIAFYGLIGLAWAFPSNGLGMESNTHTVAKRSQLNKNDFTHLVVPHDGKDSSAMKDLENTIASITGTTHIHAWASDGQTKWFYAGLDEDQVKKLEGDPRVNYIVENPPVVPSRVEHIESRSDEVDLDVDDPPQIHEPDLSKRDTQQYTFQSGTQLTDLPPDELCILSTPEGLDWRCRSKYYYASEAGEGSELYYIEDVRYFKSIRAFENRLEPPLLTDIFNALPSGQEAPPSGHATCVADKAIGKDNGAAKKSTMKHVRIGLFGGAQIAEAIKTVVEDVKRVNAKRFQQSHNRLLLMALGDNATDDQVTREPYISMRFYISELFHLGVPVVTAPVNDPKNYRNYPSGWVSDDFPLIVVGNSHRTGGIVESSWRGAKVTTYAMGVGVACVGPNNGKGGTSYGESDHPRDFEPI
ncbi:Subtilisin-like protein [Penicillium capsulatum]|uniref:Subtilisin-like protein n=1 Tax=Penicillium capsulatum TaxID=69766 RepID=A0A9W9I8Q9_9EURO|nr:Subtilisin-like protein [Penicillium capsulatum]